MCRINPIPTNMKNEENSVINMHLVPLLQVFMQYHTGLYMHV